MKKTNTLADLNAVELNPANPRRITQEARERLRKALDKFGDLSGIVFNRTTGHLVGANQRVSLFKEQKAELHIEDRHAVDKRGTTARGYVLLDGERYGYREVEWDFKREQAAMLAANNHAGEWEDEAVAAILGSLDEEMRMLTGFNDEAVKTLLETLDDPVAPDAFKVADENIPTDYQCP